MTHEEAMKLATRAGPIWASASDRHEGMCKVYLAAMRPDIEAEARRDALAEAAEEADRFTCGGCGMDGMAGTAIRALGDEPATEAAGDADELPPLPPEAVAQMRAIAADHDEAPLRDAWRRGAEAMRDKIADSSYELRIALAHLLPPYQPKEPTP